MLDEDQVAVVDALLPNVPFDGWTRKSVAAALASLGRPVADAVLYFPEGAGEMIEAFCALADARMAAAAAAEDVSGLRVPERVKAILALRFAQNAGNKEAIRRALAWLALPRNARRAARITAATVDAVWHAAGDRSADFSWYTKRGILAGVYGATLLYWLADASPDDAAVLAFLDRRLAGVARLGRWRRHQALKSRLPAPA